jgi:hypothetical protein
MSRHAGRIKSSSRVGALEGVRWTGTRPRIDGWLVSRPVSILLSAPLPEADAAKVSREYQTNSGVKLG